MNVRYVYHIIIFLLAFFIRSLSAQEINQFLDIENKLERIESQILSPQTPSNQDLNQIRMVLKQYQQSLLNCKNNLDLEIEEVHSNLKFIPKEKMNEQLSLRRQQYQNEYDNLKSSWHFCNLLDKKLITLRVKLNEKLKKIPLMR
jgi:hypothetical protein